MAWPSDQVGRWRNKLNKTPWMGIICTIEDRGVKFPISSSAEAFDGTFRTPVRSNNDQFHRIDRFKHAEIQFLPKQNDRLTIKQSFEIVFPTLPTAANLTSAFEKAEKSELAKSFEESVLFWGLSRFMTGADLTIRIEMELSSVSTGCCQQGRYHNAVT